MTQPAGPVYEFGRNWAEFVARHLDAATVEHATRSFVALVGTDDLSGRSFVDVGCGSGLSSLVAHRLGAERIISFDVDPQSVACCRHVREHAGSPPGWEVLEGSALDRGFLDGLGRFDVVYSWGVLHHTGAMWRAIADVTRLVAPGGALAVAIYNRADRLRFYPDGRFGPSAVWVPLKRMYCAVPRVLQSAADYGALAVFALVCLVRLRSPARELREYRRMRGMDLRTDISDWLGGYPYEYASPDEVAAFLAELGLTLDRLIEHGGLRCNEFLFRAAPAQGDSAPASSESSSRSVGTSGSSGGDSSSARR